MCERISEDLALHVLRVHATVGTGLRRTYRDDAARSNSVRSAAAQTVLDEHCGAIVVHELQGDLYFASMEVAFRSIVDDASDAEFVVLDFRRVVKIDRAARSLLNALDGVLTASGRTLVFAHADSSELDALPSAGWGTFADVDLALEWCEDQLLTRVLGTELLVDLPLHEQELLRDLSEDEVGAISARATIDTVASGTTVVREGEPADALYFVLSGVVSVRLGLGTDGRERRLATFGPGMAFGEMALIDDGKRSADVVTDEITTLARIAVADLRELGATHPELLATLYRNLSCQLAAWLQRANAQVRALDR